MTDPVDRGDGAHGLTEADPVQLAGQARGLQRQLVTPAQQEPQFLGDVAGALYLQHRFDGLVEHDPKVSHRCSGHNAEGC